MKKVIPLWFVKEALFSPLTIGGILLVSIFSWWSSNNYIQSDVVRTLDLVLSLSMIKPIIFLISPIPSLWFIYSLIHNKCYLPLIIRSNRKKLAQALVFFNSFSTFIVCFLGLLVFILILTFALPFLNNPNIESPYKDFLNSFIPFSYAIVRITIFSLASIVWSNVGLIGSTLINSPTPLVFIVLPFISSYVCEDLFMPAPPLVNIYYLTRGVGVNFGNSLLNLLYVVGFFMIIIVSLSLTFISAFGRKVQND